MKKSLIQGTLLILIVFGLSACRSTFPYGESHCCIKNLNMSLMMYAEDHSGRFPAGEKTPERSLSLIATKDYGINAEILRGKTVPLQITQRSLDDGTFGPDSTGWHYVEGLTLADNLDLAIIWDKVGLDHFGRRLKGGHEVGFVGGWTRIVPGTEWKTFSINQAKLRASRDEFARKGLPRLIARIKLPDGKILEQLDGSYELENKTANSSGKESGSGPQLQWYQIPWEDDVTLILNLPDRKLRSKPITLPIKNYIPSSREFLFEMENY